MHPFSNRLIADDQFFLTRDAIAAGLDDKAIARRVRAGDWVRIRHGAYTTREHWSALAAQGRRRLVARAAYRTAGTPVLLSHTSMLDELGLAVWDMPDGVHLTRLDQKAGRRSAGVIQHRGLARASDVTRRNGMWMTSGTRTALDCLTLTGVERGLVLAWAVLKAKETTLDLLREGARASTYRPGSLSEHVVLSLLDGRLESVAECRALFLFWNENLPMPELQYPVFDRNGRLVAVLDFAWPRLGVFAEVDGKIKYTDPDREGETAVDVVLREKRRDQLVTGLTGMRGIRLDWHDLGQSARTAQRLRSAFADRPWAA